MLYNIYNPDDVRRIAAIRDKSVLNYASTKKMSVHSEVAGVAAELMFACTYGLPMNDTFLSKGDPGYDFFHNGYYIDCKASTNARRLLIPVGKGKLSNIYVNYYVNPDTLFALPLGWESGSVMACCPIHDFGQGPAHWKFSNELQPMWDLHEMLSKPAPHAGGEGD